MLGDCIGCHAPVPITGLQGESQHQPPPWGQARGAGCQTQPCWHPRVSASARTWSRLSQPWGRQGGGSLQSHPWWHKELLSLTSPSAFSEANKSPMAAARGWAQGQRGGADQPAAPVMHTIPVLGSPVGLTGLCPLAGPSPTSSIHVYTQREVYGTVGSHVTLSCSFWSSEWISEDISITWHFQAEGSRDSTSVSTCSALGLGVVLLCSEPP